MFARKIRFTSRIFRGAASILAFAGVLISSLGIVVLPEPKQASSQAFPCQGGRCGCSSAAQCWQSCCCTSVAQRLAWAKVNDVTPPAFLIELLATSPDRPLVKEPKLCCRHESEQADDADACAVAREREALARVVLISDLNRCRGLSKYIAVFGSAICEPLPDNWSFDGAAGRWLQTLDESFESPFPSPPIPPPRIVV
ncbi:MAG: hypothetical protein O3C40_00625 [Planctomycetota bacterium]|nr:hypothetical protein [Planctomycetota bacterium]